MRRFENKKVVVTGGTKGIGFTIAKHFLEEGATVAILGRCPDRGDDACKKTRRGCFLLFNRCKRS